MKTILMALIYGQKMLQYRSNITHITALMSVNAGNVGATICAIPNTVDTILTNELERSTQNSLPNALEEAIVQKLLKMTPINLLIRSSCLILSLFSFSAQAAQIYITDYASDADAKVYVTQYQSDANCIVYETAYKSDNAPGVWYFTKYKSDARATIFYTKYKSDASLIVYFTKYKSDARCRY